MFGRDQCQRLINRQVKYKSRTNSLKGRFLFHKNKIWKPKKGKVPLSALPSKSELELRRIRTNSLSDDDDIYDEVFDVRSVSSA